MNIGDRFGRLVVLELIKDRKNPKARCICDCGKEATPQRGSLRNGRAQSCGCLAAEKLRSASTKHGLSKTHIYRNWHNMIRRCTDPRDKAYPNYGGRGIAVHPDWLNFEQFVTDMGPRPPGCTLERKDNNGPYSKDNCKWGTWFEQSTNKRMSKRWFIHGIEYPSAKAAGQAIGVDGSTVYYRTHGRTVSGTFYPPEPGYSCIKRYE